MKLDDQRMVVRGESDQPGLQRRPVLDIQRLLQPFLRMAADRSHSLGRRAMLDAQALELRPRRSHDLFRLAELHEET